MTVFVTGIFADGIGPCLTTFGVNSSGSVLFNNAGKINRFVPGQMIMVEAPSTLGACELGLDRIHGQDNNNVQYVTYANVASITVTANQKGFYNGKVHPVVAPAVPG